MLNRALQIGLGLLLLAGCRPQPAEPPVVIVNQPPPSKGSTTVIQSPQTPPATNPKSGKGGDVDINITQKPESKPKAESDSSLTDTSGRIFTGKMGPPPTEEDLLIPVFKPSQITETDAGAYRMQTSEGTVLGMSFATGKPQDEVRQFYEQTVTGASWDASNGRLSGKYDGHRVEITIQPGATSAFEIQIWL
jgi:hypothetical protein